MYGHLKNRATYDEVLKEAQEYPYGYIALNIDEKPVILKHPYENICLLLGYDKHSNISFAQTIKDGEKTYHDPKQVTATWTKFKTKTTDIIVGPNPLIQVFVQ